jgi:hypothetical protein
LPGSISIVSPELNAEIQAQARRIAELEDAARRAVKIIDTNLYHQREKVEDAASILREALEI